MEDPICRDVPRILSSFVDTFVDFSVSGLFFLPLMQNPNPNSPQTPHSHLPSTSPPSLQTRYPPPRRLIALGDLHGDLSKSKQALRLAGLIDASDRWAGGAATLVQIGDVLDRGGDELKILYFLEKLKREASRAGGAVITMNGNHEIMNVDGDFRYVTKSGLDEFKVWADWFCVGNDIKSLCSGLPNPKDPFEGVPLFFSNVKKEILHGIRARIAALQPDGPISARFLSQNATVLVVGESVFVHGGLLPNHVFYGLERINADVRDWICGLKGRVSPSYLRGRHSVVWLRKYSHESAKNCDCSMLEHVLATIPGAKRMIMGHTIQQNGINSVCENKAIRIDVGMSKGCTNGLPEVLEINGNSDLRILTSNPLYQKKHEYSAQVDRREGLGLLLPKHGSRQAGCPGKIGKGEFEAKEKEEEGVGRAREEVNIEGKKGWKFFF